MKIGIKIFVIFAIILSLISIFGYLKIQKISNTSLILKHSKIYTLSKGVNGTILEKQLKKLEIIPKNIWLWPLLKFQPKLTHLKIGTYLLKKNMTIRNLLETFSKGKEMQFFVRFIEGTCLKEWLKILQTLPYIQHTLKDDQFKTVAKALKINSNELEGFFYPDTYFYTANTNDIKILKEAHNHMNKILKNVWKTRISNLPYKEPKDLLTIASIIEKETSITEERKKISSVLINRLRSNLRLQTDPTVIYGMGSEYNGKLTRKNILKPNSYNTYIINGLPPGPISMPGRTSLEAAAHPKKTNFFYFVANGKGKHTFSTDLISHNKAVKKYRMSL